MDSSDLDIKVGILNYLAANLKLTSMNSGFQHQKQYLIYGGMGFHMN